MTKDLSILEQLCYSTTRIETESSDGNKYTGTGFFYNLSVAGKIVPSVITNRHVVEGMTKGRFKFTTADENQNPVNNEHFYIEFSVDFEQMWEFHPDKNIDLCAMPIGQILSAAKKLNRTPFYRNFDNNLLPTTTTLDDLDVVEDILMIGYPNGIWDEHNNMPIIRKGTTATHPVIDYNGKKEFVIDAACFPGSSGSPVVICNKGGYTTKKEHRIGANRILFLGVLYSGPQHTATGELQIVNVPHLHKPMAFSRIPNNLGFVIKAENILDLELPFKKRLNL